MALVNGFRFTIAGSSLRACLMRTNNISRELCSNVKKPDDNAASSGLHRTHRPNELEKKFLVWTKKYKSVDEVPGYVK